MKSRPVRSIPGQIGKALTDQDGQLRGVALECELVPVKIPNYVTHPQRAKVTANGVSFDPADPDGVYQTTPEGED